MFLMLFRCRMAGCHLSAVPQTDPRRNGSHLGGDPVPPGGSQFVTPSRGRSQLPMIGQQHRHSAGAEGGPWAAARSCRTAREGRPLVPPLAIGPSPIAPPCNGGDHPRPTSAKESVTKLTIDNATGPRDEDDLSLGWPAMESSEHSGKLRGVSRMYHRVVCRYTTHDWWALAYPPARRWECRRCGRIVEETSTAKPDRRRQPRTPTKSNFGNTPGPS